MKDLVNAQLKAGEMFTVSVITAYISDQFAKLFDLATDWLSKIVLPAISTIVDELTAAGFFYSEIFGTAITQGIEQAWNVASSVSHALGNVAADGINSAAKFFIGMVFKMVRKVSNAGIDALGNATGHDVMGHNCIDNDHIGYNYISRNYVRRAMPAWTRWRRRRAITTWAITI